MLWRVSSSGGRRRRYLYLQNASSYLQAVFTDLLAYLHSAYKPQRILILPVLAQLAPISKKCDLPENMLWRRRDGPGHRYNCKISYSQAVLTWYKRPCAQQGSREGGRGA